MSGEEEGYCHGRREMREEIIEWIKDNKITASDTLEEFILVEDLLDFLKSC